LALINQSINQSINHYLDIDDVILIMQSKAKITTLSGKKYYRIEKKPRNRDKMDTDDTHIYSVHLAVLVRHISKKGEVR
jgi:hypothetical protein